jgi:hypothetical protein
VNDFEAKIRLLLDESAPCCTLSGVTLYRPDRFGGDDPFGYEIDNMLHWQSGGDDRIVILECKNAPIRVASTTTSIPPENQEWFAPIRGESWKNLKDQLFNQAESVWQNLCLPPNPRRRIDAIVVTSSAVTHLKCRLYSEAGLTLHLIGETDLVGLLGDPQRLASVFDTAPGGRFLRVAQSDILRMARQSMVVPELGHPEIDHAIELIRRCRQTLDGRLFDFFKPTERRWAINGSAGMGKSVLLAYAVAVYSTGKVFRELPRERNDRTPLQTNLAEHANGDLSLPPLGDRRIAVIGLKPRQLEVLQEFWFRFFNRFKQLAGNYLSAVQPSFIRWRPQLDLDAFNIVCIDEAHDLTSADQERIAQWWNQKQNERYLVIACDRHQRLRFASADEERWMIKGVPFSGCSTRLSRNYRSPIAVYCAGLALMFRWFAPQGAKVVPEKAHLIESFGFQVRLVDRRKEGRVALTLINDAHPANHWRYTVSRFAHTDAAYAWLDANRLQHEDVLWVRFHEEFPEAEHDSEHIKVRFNYKALNSLDSHSIIDAEIKGRDFPVVVIEGFPRGMGATVVDDDVWCLRRQVYLCASRATAFLFFVFKDDSASPEKQHLKEELDAMLAALASPADPNQSSTKKWSFEFSLPESPVGMDVFQDDATEEMGVNREIADDATATPLNGAPKSEVSSAADNTPAVAPNAAAVIPLAEILPNRVELPPVSLEPVPAAEIVPAAEPPSPAPTIELPRGPEIGRRGTPRRIHEIARAIGWEGKALLEHLQRSNYKVKSVSHPVDRITAEALIKELGGKPQKRSMSAPTPAELEPVSQPANAPESGVSSEPALLPEKEFQRRYGHIRDWKKTLWANYLSTGRLPAHFEPRLPARSPVTSPAAQQAKPKAVLSPYLTTHQLAGYLDVKPFKLIGALRERSKKFVTPTDLVFPADMAEMCQQFGRSVPTPAQLVQLASISPPPAMRNEVTR